MYFASIEVHLDAPLALVADDGETERAALTGFVQELGCTASDRADLEARVRSHVAAYELGPSRAREILFLEVDELESVEALTDDAEVLAEIGDRPARAGIWYTGARAFYSEDPPGAR